MPQEVSAPVSTYRLQFNKDFGLCAATQLLDYFSSLGITDIYASPILASRKGSRHGYDVIDPTRLDPDIGSEEDFEIFQDELVKRGMGLLLDIVPNHMAACSENRWWMDVLENGAQSVFASYFDIDWNPPSRSLTGKVFLPVLAQPFGDALDQGQIRLTYEAGRFFVQYHDSNFPIAPESYHFILDFQSSAGIGADQETSEFQEFFGILAGFAALPGELLAQGAAVARPKFNALSERLRLLASEHSEIAAILDSKLTEFNGIAHQPETFRALERLLNQQHYLLAYWQDPNEGINYRRFFAISDLVGVRVDDPVVFDATHDYTFRILAKAASKGLRVGLRIDHIDGLRDPAGYLARVQQRVSEISNAPASHAYVIVEKILGVGEKLPGDWPISGTTGYEFMNSLNRVFVSPEDFARIENGYSKFTGRETKFADVVFESKKRVMNSLLRVEVRGLARQLAELAAKDRYARNISRIDLMEALTEVTACMPVYRTYIRTLDVPVDAKTTIEQAICAARERRPQLGEACVAFLRDVLTLARPAHILPEQQEERLTFVMRWQQFTGPIFAKGFEDTALYIYYPLSSLNEVGGTPEGPGRDPREAFFQLLTERHERWPQSLNTTMTHDAKRGEDVRARINVLSEIPTEWTARVTAWSKANAAHKRKPNGREVPDTNEEYLVYQTLVGMWPSEMAEPVDTRIVTRRLQQYMVKAVREAALHSRWVQPDEQHESSLIQFIENILSPDDANEFLRDADSFCRQVAWSGAINSLVQTLLKIMSPGVPDFYQGSELWDLRLVDPENREPVDFLHRRHALNAIMDSAPDIENAQELLKRWRDGTVKLFAAKQALEYRRAHRELFIAGDFMPLKARGARSENVIAILRSNGSEHAIAAAPRRLRSAFGKKDLLPPADFWEGTSICLPESAPDAWTNLFTGERLNCEDSVPGARTLDVHKVLCHFPVALLGPVYSK